jgi:hypothetical protein
MGKGEQYDQLAISDMQEETGVGEQLDMLKIGDGSEAHEAVKDKDKQSDIEMVEGNWDIDEACKANREKGKQKEQLEMEKGKQGDELKIGEDQEAHKVVVEEDKQGDVEIAEGDQLNHVGIDESCNVSFCVFIFVTQLCLF